MGNPGARFAGTRHNVGFDVVEAVAASAGLVLRKAFLRPYEWASEPPPGPVLVRPLTYMNRSGQVLPSLLKKTRLGVGDLVIVCDNLDLPPGSVRIKRKGTARSHNGLASVMDVLGTGEFTRIYLGIGRPAKGQTVVDHVLSRPPEEEVALYHAAIHRAADVVRSLSHESIETVMNRLNSRT